MAWRSRFGGLLCAGLLLAAPARADGPKAPALNWVRTAGAEGCIAAYELSERVEGRLDRVVFVPPSEAELFVDGYVAPVSAQQDATGYEVLLRISDRNGQVLGERALRSADPDCRALDEAVAVVIAVTLYPDSAMLSAGIPLQPETAATLQSLFSAEPTDPDPATLPAAAEPAPRQQGDAGTSTSTSTPPPPQPAKRATPWGLGADLAVLGGIGQLPGIAAGLGGYLHLDVASWTLELGVGLWPATQAAADTGYAEISLMYGSLSVCPWTLSTEAAHLCLGFELGRISVEPHNFAVMSDAQSDLLANPFLGLIYRPVVIGPLRARLALTALLPLVQRGYSYQTLQGSSERLFRTAQLAVRFELGLAVQF